MANDFTALNAKFDELKAALDANKQTLQDVLAALKALPPSDVQPQIDALTDKVQAAIDEVTTDDAGAEAAIKP